VSRAEGRCDGFANGARGTDEEDTHGGNLSAAGKSVAAFILRYGVAARMWQP